MNPTETFIQETVEGLEQIEALLLELEPPATPTQIDELFRNMHTIKGSAAMFGFDALARFTHSLENAYDLVRAGKLALTRALVDVSLAASDHMTALLEANDTPAEIERLEASQTAQDLAARIAAIVAPATGAAETPGAAAPAQDAPDTAHDAPRRVQVRYMPGRDTFRFGGRPDLLLAELAELGDVDATLDLGAVPPLADLDAQDCYLAWDITVTTRAPRSAIDDVFVFVDEAEIAITEAPDAAEPDAVQSVVEQDKPDEPIADDTTGAPRQRQKSATIRVPSDRLDDLMTQLGELVIAQTRLDRLANDTADPALMAVAEDIDRLVTGLRDSTLAMRMLPIEVVFGKFRRVVRSLSDELGKDVRLETSGGATELDKTVIDSLTEPLVHMIRNSMDHGIEDAQGRRDAGKPEQATVALVARQSGGEVLISVCDDGRGLDAEAIRARAIERGLIGRREEDTPPLDQLYKLIFEPAFSTAKAVSSVSGRGVGMDAVRSVVDELRGSIDIDTRKGRGTTITLRLPVTLAIIDGLLVQLGESVFILPLSAVSECVELADTEYENKSGRTLLRIRDELVPFIKLDAYFGTEPRATRDRRVVIVGAEGRRVGLVVDDVLGQHQTVIKTFSQFHRDIDGFAGSTILGDGRVALIVDVQALIRSVQADAETTPARVA